jgi:hypothetical protein
VLFSSTAIYGYEECEVLDRDMEQQDVCDVHTGTKINESREGKAHSETIMQIFEQLPHGEGSLECELLTHQWNVNYSPTRINRYVRPTNDNESSINRPNRQSSLSDSRPNHQSSSSDTHPALDVRTRSNNQCIYGRWGHSVENCQQMAMHFLIVKYLQKYANLESAGQISECWRLANEQYSWSTHSTVRAIRDVMPEDMAVRTDDETMETLYNEDDALSDFI